MLSRFDDAPSWEMCDFCMDMGSCYKILHPHIHIWFALGIHSALGLVKYPCTDMTYVFYGHLFLQYDTSCKLCQMLPRWTENPLHSIIIWDTVTIVLPLYSVYQARPNESNLTSLALTPTEWAYLSMLFILEVVCTACMVTGGHDYVDPHMSWLNQFCEHHGLLIYLILAVIRAHHVCNASPSSFHLPLCNPVTMGIYIRLLVQPPICLSSNINQRWAYHHENTVHRQLLSLPAVQTTSRINRMLK